MIGIPVRIPVINSLGDKGILAFGYYWVQCLFFIDGRSFVMLLTFLSVKCLKFLFLDDRIYRI